MVRKKKPSRPAKNGSSKNKASIKVVGIGGGGGNAISRMKDGFIKGVEFIAVNTDAQDLDYCNAHKRIYIGKAVTRGLGTGMNPELGRQAAEESRADIAGVLQGADLVFITAGLGGGTGSGGSAPIAEIAKEMGALTIAVVTKPFAFEGGQRAKIAEEALAKIKEKVDACIIVPNDKIFSIIGKETSVNKAFDAIDSVLKSAVQGVAELIAMPGIINVDFADVKTIMQNSGTALVGVGAGFGKERSAIAVRQVLNFPLLDIMIDGAKGVLFGISGGKDLKMSEINEIAQSIVEHVDSSAKIIFGAYHSRKLKQGVVKVTLIATGFGAENIIKMPTSEFKPPTLFNGSGSEPTELPISKINLAKEVKPALPPKPEANLREKEKNNISGNKKKTSDIWDIPAFLRKRKKE